MKINMVTPWNKKCGNADYAKALMEWLDKRADVRIIEIVNPETKNPLEFYELAKRASSDCDVIHVQHGYALFGRLIFTGIYTPVLYLFLNKKRRIVTSLHDVEDYEKTGVIGFMRMIYRRLIDGFIFRYSDILHVHTKAAKASLLERGVPEDKIVILPLGVFIEPKTMKREECKSKLGLSGKRVVTIFGFVHPNKGHDLVIDALPSLHDDIILVIAGLVRNDPYFKGLMTKAKELGVEDRVIYLGYLTEEDLPSILNASDLAVLPYRRITQSSVLNRLLAYGIPVLTSYLPVFREIKADYGCIETFKSGNAEDLSEKMEELLSDESRVEFLKGNISKYLRDNSPENIVNGLLKIYGGGA